MCICNNYFITIEDFSQKNVAFDFVISLCWDRKEHFFIRFNCCINAVGQWQSVWVCMQVYLKCWDYAYASINSSSFSATQYESAVSPEAAGPFAQSTTVWLPLRHTCRFGSTCLHSHTFVFAHTHSSTVSHQHPSWLHYSLCECPWTRFTSLVILWIASQHSENWST